MDNGRVLAIWSAAGSPGRTTIACSLATLLAESNKKVLLVDADMSAPSIDLVLGLNDHPAGLAAAFRLIGQNRFDLEQLRRLSVELGTAAAPLTVMTGLSSSRRWPEISPANLQSLIELAANHFDFILLDLSFSLEPGLKTPHASIDRNSISRWSLAIAHQVIAVCGADPVAIARHIEAMSQLTDLSPAGEVLTLVNRLRTSVLGMSAKQQVQETLSRMGQIQVAGFVPDDPAVADSALRQSLPLVVAKRSSQARQALSIFTKTQILGELNPLDRRMRKKALAKLD
jgi:MinD-like ATPase involved in chromosome partitioning or flagellar assembly